MVPGGQSPVVVDSRLTVRPRGRSRIGMVGLAVVVLVTLACVGSLPWTLGTESGGSTPRYNAGRIEAARLPPSWWPFTKDQAQRLDRLASPEIQPHPPNEAEAGPIETAPRADQHDAASVRSHRPRYTLGSDVLGRSLLTRLLTGGGISLAIGIAAAFLSVCIGTVYGMVAGYAGGRIDALMMRIVDVLYGLPYVLLVVLLAVAGDALVDRVQRGRIDAASRQREAYIEHAIAADPSDETLRHQAYAQALAAYGTGEISRGARMTIDVLTLLAAIGGVSWLTLARVIRGQVLSLKAMPFVEAARVIGASPWRIMRRHLLPNLVGPIVVYSTLTVPQAILQESFLSFLGIGVKPPLPSWGTLAADGLSELNPFASNWWLLVFPCAALGITLVALNFIGEGLREALDPKRARA